MKPNDPQLVFAPKRIVVDDTTASDFVLESPRLLFARRSTAFGVFGIVLVVIALIWIAFDAFAAGATGATLTATTSTTTIVDVTTVGDGLDTVFALLGAAVELASRAYRRRDWMLLSGVLLAGVVLVLRKIRVLKSVPTEWTPAVAAALSMAVSISVGLQTHQTAKKIFVTALSVLVASIGTWEGLMKPIARAFASKRPSNTSST